MKRWVALLPGQVWSLANGETIKIIDTDGEGGLIFECKAPHVNPKAVVADYELLDKYISEREGALVV